jgi:hypothetical protein
MEDGWGRMRMDEDEGGVRRMKGEEGYLKRFARSHIPHIHYAIYTAAHETVGVMGVCTKARYHCSM